MSYCNCAWITVKFCSLNHWHWFFLAQNTTCIKLSSESSSMIIATCQQWNHPALAPMAYFWKELHGFTIITQTGREKGRVGEQREKKSFQSGWTDQLPWTPCCSGQTTVPVTSCPTLILSAKFPEDSSCHLLQTSVSAHSIQGCVPVPHFCEAAHLLSTPQRCWSQWGWGCWKNMFSRWLEDHGWGGPKLAITSTFIK